MISTGYILSDVELDNPVLSKESVPPRRKYYQTFYIKNRIKLREQGARNRKDNRLRYLLATIRHRCESPKHKSFRWYGGKGIKNFLILVDLRFLWDRDNADSMKRPSIDRIDTNGHYERDNCRFIELSENLKNSWINKKKRIASINIRISEHRKENSDGTQRTI